MEFQAELKEVEGKRVHDPLMEKQQPKSGRCVWVPGPVIVGAGPSGLAAAACLKTRGIPSLILERFDCIASLWRLKTYDRLRLHLPKSFCELPMMPFPADFPTYPTKQQFLSYLESYAAAFGISPSFNTAVESAEYDEARGFWRVRTRKAAAPGAAPPPTEYACQWLVVATGENAEEVLPEIEGMGGFSGRIVHSSGYRTGELFREKAVLVVGCGNSGMEVCLDLCNYKARPSLVIRDSVHVLPQQVLGRSTFGLSMWLLRWFPMHLVDRFLLLVSRLTLGDTSRLGLRRPKIGPLRLKSTSGKTPVLDVGTLALIRAGNIKVLGAIKRITRDGAEFVDGRVENFDDIILATGYKSNVPSWLKERDMFNEKDGLPRKPFPNGWKGKNGLYAIGFTKRGLLGASMDARRVAEDIEDCWKSDENHFMPFASSVPQQQKIL